MRGPVLNALINCLFDLPPHRSSIRQDLVTRYSHDAIPLLGQILVAVLIMLAAFGGLMMLTVDFDDRFQFHVTKVDCVRRDRIFAMKLLSTAAAVAVAGHLPDVLRELICAGSLITGKGDRIGIAPGSSLRVFAPIHHLPLLQTRCFCPSSPALLPTLKASKTRFQRGEKGASL